ncbi:FMN phosphatase YigB (HAD superfamily) [Thermosporothrix hazakensis]|jgi:FMN phosphatase YigB (HAD superfamily)|uniref:FMN phosphatase YigB (HAD superfamily) n=1 Tax=Thermosporothrix hazakensis TaxID=644383 RepID=A0A326UAJ2_THEHA|nr:HAD family hydrolase [Thermosporothrix hazakensis]PZW31950.1 FMN phosphatase YigB (HAD superfamily) [Thermosporothrix hazakensis]GCE49725.1 hypothetical protein KTH_45940 [Thermosporothrix hazakensis]
MDKRALVFWIDVDNTLLDNDKVKKSFDEVLRVNVGEKLTRRFWELYEEIRAEKSVIDIPLTLERLRAETPQSEMDDYTYQHIHSIFEHYPYRETLYTHALDTLHHLSTLGTTVIVSDGDPVFQAEKIVNSTIADAVEGRVLLYVHKQENLQDMIQQYPADHYVMIDDKPTILDDMHHLLGSQVTTVFVKQGKYASQPLPAGFTPDISVEHIGDLLTFSKEQFLPHPTPHK